MENKIHEKLEMKIYKLDSKATQRGRKKIFFESYNPEFAVDVKKTAESFGVSVQMVYKWIKSYKEDQK